jgi:hypothetical protein
MDAKFFNNGLMPLGVNLRVDPRGIAVTVCHEVSLYKAKTLLRKAVLSKKAVWAALYYSVSLILA